MPAQHLQLAAVADLALAQPVLEDLDRLPSQVVEEDLARLLGAAVRPGFHVVAAYGHDQFVVRPPVIHRSRPGSVVCTGGTGSPRRYGSLPSLADHPGHG